MFKLHKPHLASSSNIIHSGHFMVSRYDDDEDDQNDAGDDSSESERDNGQNYEIDVSNPDAVADATKSLDISYQVQSPSAKNELVTSWNDLDRPPSKRPHQYLTYYTNKSSSGGASGQSKPNGTGIDGDLGGGQRRKVLVTSSGCSPSSTIISVVNSSGDPDLDEPSSVPVDATIEGRGGIERHSTLVNAIATTTRTRTATETTTAAASQLADPAGNLHLVAAAASAAASTERAAVTSTMITSIDPHYDDGNNEPHDLRGGEPAGSQQRHQTIDLQSQLQNNLQVQQVYQNPDSQKHALTIDASLTKLLESMSLYYSSKLTSPKWKSFKGLKLRMKHKIRLNNLIWRAWFLQCIRGREPPGCQFTAPAETDVHKKSETIVLEGKYWKRKEKAIVDEYKKWRIFHKQKSQIAMCQMHCFRPSSFDWDTRVSNWASSSSVHGAELSFYPDDYDANLSYNLDELNPMPGQLEPDTYYQPNPISQAANMGTRMIEAPQQQQQQTMPAATATTLQTISQQPQSAQFITQPQVPSRVQENPTNHNQVQNQAHLQQQLHHHHQALSLKADRSTPMQQYSADQMHQLGPPQAINIGLPNFANHHQHQLQQQQPQQQPQNHLQQHQHSQQHSNFHQHQLQHQQMQHNSHLQQHQLQQQHQQLVPFSFENNAVYQQIQQQQQQPHQLNQAHQQQMHQQQLQDQPDSYSNHQDFCSVSSGGSSIISGMEGGRTEQRRVCHINAEQKRRCNIKNGFDTLKSILPSVGPSTNVKVSKASMLQKAAGYINQLSAEQKQQLDEQAILRQQVDSLKQAILAQQAQLPPVSGVLLGPSATSASTIRAREMFQDYIRKRTNENWKFWIFSLLIEPLYESYHRAVNANSLEEAFKTVYGWLDQSVGLSSLRRDATESLTVLSTNTNVLTSPQTLPTEAVEAVRYPNNLQQHSTTSSSTSASANRSMQILPDLTGTSQTCYSEATF